MTWAGRQNLNWVQEVPKTLFPWSKHPYNHIFYFGGVDSRSIIVAPISPIVSLPYCEAHILAKSLSLFPQVLDHSFAQIPAVHPVQSYV